MQRRGVTHPRQGRNCELHLAVEGDGADGTHELESYLQERLPSYMLPKHIHFFASFPPEREQQD